MKKTPTIPTDLQAQLALLPPEARDQLMQELFTELARQRPAGPDFTTSDGIVRFVREKLRAKPEDYQETILRALIEYRRVSVRSLHGAGKTAVAAWAILWALYAFAEDTKVLVTASAWRQVEKFTFPEVKKWAYRGSLEPRPRMLETELKLPDKEAFGAVSDNPYLLEGLHASNVLVVMDEAKAISDAWFDSLEGALASGNTYALMLSTPGTPSGRFYDIQTRKPGYQDWYSFHITLEMALAAGRITPKWVEDRKKQWGEQSAVYQNRVLGEFADSDEDSVIPLSWIEKGVDRWHNRKDEKLADLSLGVDPARYGSDRTAICYLYGTYCAKIAYSAREDTMQTAGRVAAVADKKDTSIAVDVIGVGAGVFDRLRELGYKVTAVNVAEHTDQKDTTDQLHFVNLRSWLWWALREVLDPTNEDAIAIPPDDLLIGDLSAPKYTYTSTGKIKVESKDEIRTRIGRSTDGADSLALALYMSKPRKVYWEPEVVGYDPHPAYFRRGRW